MLGVLCIIRCPVQLIREVSSRLHLCRHTFASLWGDGLRRVASRWRANSRGDSYVLGVHLSNICWGLLFVFVKHTYFKSLLKVYYQSVFVESSKAFNTLSKILPRIKPSYFSAWFVTVFGKCVRLLVHAWMKPSCLARRPLCHKVNLPRCEARRRYFIMTCDIFGTEQTNILARGTQRLFSTKYLFGEANLDWNFLLLEVGKRLLGDCSIHVQ